MILKVHEMSSQFQMECEGCHCHSWLKDPRYASQREHLQVARKVLDIRKGSGAGVYDGNDFRCPFAGKAAVKLASGRIH
eukprot:799165-Heterocapsa_arctica.AAC.1